MPRQYGIYDHADPNAATLFRPCPDDALTAGHALAAARTVRLGYSSLLREQCEDGTMFFGELVDLDTGETLHVEPLVWVDEVGRLRVDG